MAEFTDASLSHRARNLSLWLCDLANPALDRRNHDASADMLLRELPDHWTAEEAARLAQECRMHVGPKASHRAWLSAAGLLVGEQERLPVRPPQGMSLAAREEAQRRLRDVLAMLGRKP